MYTHTYIILKFEQNFETKVITLKSSVSVRLQAQKKIIFLPAL